MPEYSANDVERAGRPADEALARAYQGGSRAAGEELARRWSRSISALCRSMLGSAADAEDACQEVFLRMARDIGRWDGTRAPGPWLVGIAKNVCRDARAKGRGASVAAEPVAEAVDTILQREDEARVAAAMETLPPHYQELLLYKFKMELPNAEIAKLLGIAPQSLCVYYQRAMILLRAKVKNAPVA